MLIGFTISAWCTRFEYN